MSIGYVFHGLTVSAVLNVVILSGQLKGSGVCESRTDDHVTLQFNTVK